MLSILSYNIFNQTTKKGKTFLDTLFKNGYTLNTLPDIILTQEHSSVFFADIKDKYQEYCNHGNGCESIGMLHKSGIRNIKLIKNIVTSCYDIEDDNGDADTNNNTNITDENNLLNNENIENLSRLNLKKLDLLSPNRYGFIYNINGFNIANLHLDGGRYSDKQLPFAGYQLLLYKINVLVKILRHKPDIICGDFNSIYLDSNTTFTYKQVGELYKQIHYMRHQIFKRKLTQSEIKFVILINYFPYKLLKDNGYVYAKPENYETCITSSRGSNVIDTIWYLPERVRCIKSNIVDCGKAGEDYLFGELSDHNPVYGSFELC
jgi:exonuclease III